MKPLRCAIFQPDATDEPPPARLERLGRVLADRGDAPLDLLVCPELFLSGYGTGDLIRERAEPRDGPFAAAAAALARRYGTALVYGAPERDGESIFNTAVCFDRDGGMMGVHRKLALPNDYEKRYFALGEAPTMVRLGDWQVGLLVCYDVEFPESVRSLALAGCHLVSVPTALGAQWGPVARTLIPARAFENNIYLAYADWCGSDANGSYFGESVICDPMAADLARAHQREELIEAVLDPHRIGPTRELLPYLRDLSDGRVGRPARMGDPAADRAKDPPPVLTPP